MKQESCFRIDCDDGHLTDDTNDASQPLDDLAITGDLIKSVRLERMASDEFWGSIYLKDGRTVWLGFYVKKRPIKADVRWEP